MVFVKECLQRQEGRYCPTEDQKEENRSLSDYGLKTISPKKSRLKKNIKRNVYGRILLKFQIKFLSIDKKQERGAQFFIVDTKRVVKSAVRRNEIRKETKEIFRKNKSLSDGYNFLVKN